MAREESRVGALKFVDPRVDRNGEEFWIQTHNNVELVFGCHVAVVVKNVPNVVRATFHV
jgi:hypothetical protein